MRHRIALAALLLLSPLSVAQPTSQPAGSASSQDHSAELVAQVAALRAENAHLKDRLAAAEAKLDALVRAGVAPASTYTDREAARIAKRREKAAANHQVDDTSSDAFDMRTAAAEDAAIEQSNSTPQMKAAMHEGRVIPGMTFEQLAAFTVNQSNVEVSGRIAFFKCAVKGNGSRCLGYAVVMTDGVVTKATEIAPLSELP